MEEQLVTFETAKLAKEKGFNEGCLDTYSDKGVLQNRYNIDICDIEDENDLKDRFETVNSILKDYYTAPSQSFLQKYLREKHNIHIVVDHYKSNKYSCRISDECDTSIGVNLFGDLFNTYEEALEAGLFGALKLIKTK